ncbi:hypothetical protein CMU71_14715 [Elizabethkingia anophelis]|nr:hypothetical protein [Elizabethkingia anophelis]
MEGKAKEEMLKWLSANYPLGWKAMEMGGLRPSFQNTLIVEWLDSMGIYLEITPDYDIFGGYNRGFYAHVIQEGVSVISVFNDNDCFNARQEATEAAIKKAVEIYNSKYGNPQGDPETTK